MIDRCLCTTSALCASTLMLTVVPVHKSHFSLSLGCLLLVDRFPYCFPQSIYLARFPLFHLPSFLFVWLMCQCQCQHHNHSDSLRLTDFSGTKTSSHYDNANSKQQKDGNSFIFIVCSNFAIICHPSTAETRVKLPSARIAAAVAAAAASIVALEFSQFGR